MLSNKSKQNKQAESSPSKAINVIGEGTVVEGNLHSKGDVRIDGTLKGTVESNSKFILGVSGTVEGDINARSADISGTVKGNLHITDTLYLKSSAKVFGDIFTGKLVIESGSEFNGQCKMGKDNVQVGSSTPSEPKSTSKQEVHAEAV